MNDAVKHDVSDEENPMSPYLRIVYAFDSDKTASEFLREDGDGGFSGAVYRMAREIDALRSAALAAPMQQSLSVKPMSWEEDGKYLKARIGDREYLLNITSDGVTWAAGTRVCSRDRLAAWGSVPNASCVSLEQAKASCDADYASRILSEVVTAPAQPATDDIADAVLSWMVKHDLLDAGNEYHASDVLAVLDDLAPSQPVSVPVGYVSTGELHTLQQADTCVDLFSTPPEDGFQFVPVYAAPQPPAEGGWLPIESAPKDGTMVDLWCRRYHGAALRITDMWWTDTTGWRDGPRNKRIEGLATGATHWRPVPLPPAPANGGDTHG